MLPADAPSAPGATALRPGGRRGTEGFFRAGQDQAGRWWLIDPQGAPFFLRGVHGVTPAGGVDDAGLPPDAAGCLRGWGFNTCGTGRAAEALRADGLPFLAAVEFLQAGRPIVGHGLRLPDVFAPEWRQAAEARAREVCALLANDSELIGWVADTELEWAVSPQDGRPGLLQLCLSLEPSFAAYHAAWEFVLALHRGRIEGLARAWHVPLANRESVRELTRNEQGLTSRGYLRDEARWAHEFARRYFTATSSAIRAVDPNHLVLGCRFRRPVGAAVLAECAYPAVDVAMPHWSELPSADAAALVPVIAGDVSWSAPEFRQPSAGERPGRLTGVERMLRRARLALTRLARHPAVVGYVWTQWQDEPGEQPPFGRGLVHVDGADAREHTELLADFNQRSERLRRGET